MNRILNWLALNHVPGIGNLLFKRLFNRFKSPERVFEASREELFQVEGMTARAVSAVKSCKIPAGAPEEIERALKKGYDIIIMSSSANS